MNEHTGHDLAGDPQSSMPEIVGWHRPGSSEAPP